GGIGGAHRGAHHSFDVSADLQELAQTPVAVVCAGAKSILDLGLTLEYLETHGVPVLGYQTDELPAFYTRNSGYALNYRVDTPLAVAQAMA
ncbi:MAG: pseudouridine-5'-phosphate glycosidase, partial [Burkholderiaceae bacterium]